MMEVQSGPAIAKGCENAGATLVCHNFNASGSRWVYGLKCTRVLHFCEAQPLIYCELAVL